MSVANDNRSCKPNHFYFFVLQIINFIIGIEFNGMPNLSEIIFLAFVFMIKD